MPSSLSARRQGEELRQARAGMVEGGVETGDLRGMPGHKASAARIPAEIMRLVLRVPAGSAGRDCRGYPA